jgi:chromosome segregation protein
VQGLERRLGHLGDVNMLAIEQYDSTAERIAGLVEDGKLLRSRREHLVSIAVQLEDERKTRLMAVFNHVNSNFSRVYKILQPAGSGKLQMENPKNPFDAAWRCSVSLRARARIPVATSCPAARNRWPHWL